MALLGIDPILNGRLLAHLDEMGHSDALVVADANFPAHRLAQRLVDLPGTGTPQVLRALLTVVPLDETPALDLMSAPDGVPLPVQAELLKTAGVDQSDVRFLARQDFYDTAAGAFVVIRTGETRIFANVVLRKGIVTTEDTG